MLKCYSILVYIVEFEFTTDCMKEAEPFTRIFEFASLFSNPQYLCLFSLVKERLESVLCGRAAFTEDVAKVN